MRKIKLKTECSHLDRIGNIYKVEIERQKLLLKLIILSPPYSCQTEAQQWLLSPAKVLSGLATVSGLRWLQGTPNPPHCFSPLCSPSNWGLPSPSGNRSKFWKAGNTHPCSPCWHCHWLGLPASSKEMCWPDRRVSHCWLVWRQPPHPQSLAPTPRDSAGAWYRESLFLQLRKSVLSIKGELDTGWKTAFSYLFP